MDFEGIMLSEVSQTKTNTVWYYLYVESKNQENKTPKLLENESMIVTGNHGKMGEDGQKIQTSSYKINKSWECNVQHDDYM